MSGDERTAAAGGDDEAERVELAPDPMLVVSELKASGSREGVTFSEVPHRD